jgi:hypothetical protein
MEERAGERRRVGFGLPSFLPPSSWGEEEAAARRNLRGTR